MPQTAQAGVSGTLITTGTSVAPTGSGPFNGLPANILPTADACTTGNNTTYTPGNDPCATDLIARTNDDVTYNIQYVTTGADTVTIASVLPTTAGTPIADWKALPPQCGTGSSISADKQTLTCVIAVTASATQSILPQATVRGTNKNGTSFPIPATTVTAAGGGNFNANVQAGSTTAPVTISAAPLYDVAKRNSVSPTYVSRTTTTGPDGTTPGWLFAFDVGVRAPYGSKGVEPINASGFTLSDVVNSITFSSSDAATAAAVQAAFRANAQLYNGNSAWPGAYPNSAGGCWANGGSGIGNAVRDPDLPNATNPAVGTYTIGSANNGTCVATQSAPGAPINITITNANWTNTHFPIYGNDGNNIVLPQPSDYWLVADQIGVWVPATVLASIPYGITITGTNTYSSVAAMSISNQAIQQPTVTDSSAGGTVNDSVSFTFTQLLGIGFAKYFNPLCSTSQNTNCASINYIGDHTRSGAAVPGQVYSTQHNISVGGTIAVTPVVCDKIDNTKQIVAINSITGTPLTNAYNASDNIPLVAGTDFAMEFGTGGLNGTGASWASNADYAIGTCGQGDSPTWYADATTVPGGLAAITKVRFTLLKPIPASKTFVFYFLMQDLGTSTVAGFGSPAGTVWPTGTPINNWDTLTGVSAATGLNVYVANGDQYTADSSGNVWYTGGIDGGPDGQSPYTAAGVANFGISDTIYQTSANARVTKTGTTSTGSTTAAIAGTTVNYSLSPVLTAPASGLPATTMTVTDILPPHLNYVPGTASIAPNAIQNNVPESGYTTLTWTLSVTPNVAIAPITYQAFVDATAKNGYAIPNFTIVTTPVDSTPCQASGGDYDQILNTGYINSNPTGQGVSGVLCVRAARSDLSISSPPGFLASKAVDKSQIEPNGIFTYTVGWLNNGTPPDVIDLIDVLPFAGDGRTPATAYTGSRTLAAAALAVTGDAAATFWSTTTASASIVSDPQDASNGGFGTPGGIWTQCPGNICPSAATAIRMLSGTAMQDGVTRSFTVTLNTRGNVPGNVYTNNFVARGSGLTKAVTSNSVSTTAVLGSISGSVYDDINNDGVMAASGEAGIGDVKVCVGGGNLATPVCQQTAANGAYTFTNLYAGNYVLTKYNDTTNSPGLAGYVDGKVTAGTFAGTTSTTAASDTISAIAVPIGGNGTTYLFGETAVGTIQVIKTVVGLPSNAGWTFTLGTVTAGCTIPAAATNPATTPSGSNVSVSFVNLPVYSITAATPTSCIYSVAETAQSGYQLNAANSTLSGSVTLNGTTTLNVENDQLYGSLTVTKNLTGGPSGTSGSFPITATCTFNGTAVTGITPSATQSATATTGGSGQVTFTHIPQGAQCQVGEGSLPAPPTSYVYDTPLVTQPTAAVGATPIAASVLNNLTQQFGSLVVTKTVSVSGVATTYSGSFPITAACVLGNTAVTGITPSATQPVTAGTAGTGSVTFANIPQGATCTVSEGSSPTTGLPTGYAWSASPPAITQAVGAISATPSNASVVNTLVQQVAGLTVIKTVAGGPSGYSDSFPISVACTSGGAAVTGITPSTTQNVTASNSASGSVHFDNIPQGATCTVSEGTLPSAPTSYAWGTPTITQSAAIAASGSTATIANTLTPIPGNLIVVKTVNVQTYTPGISTPAAYTLVVSNPSAGAISGGSVVDTAPANVSFGSWTCAITAPGTGAAVINACGANGTGAIADSVSLNPGAAATYTINATINTVEIGNVVNTATVTTPPAQCSSACASTSSATTTPVPQVSITKTTPAMTVNANGTIVYSVTIANEGSVAADGATIADPLAAGLASAAWACAGNGGAVCPAASGGDAIGGTIATFPVGGSLVYTIAATVSATPPSVITNTATLTPPAGGTCLPSNATGPCDASASVPPVPTVSIAKTTNTTTVVPNGTIVYLVTASNTGAVPAPNSTVADPLPVGIVSATWTCAASSGAACPAASGSGAIAATMALFPAGGSVVYTMTAVVEAQPPASITNTATIAPPSGGQCQPCTASATVPTPDPPEIAITKTVNVPTVAAGGTLIYTVTVSNPGIVSDSGTTISDPLPSGIASAAWTCAASGGAACPNAAGGGAITQNVATFPPGGSLVYTITAIVASDPPTSILNIAQTTPPAGGSCQPNGTQPPCTASAQVTTTPVDSLSVKVPALHAAVLALLTLLLIGTGLRASASFARGRKSSRH